MSLLVFLALLAQAASPQASSNPHQEALRLYKTHSYSEAAEAFRLTLASETPGSADYEESLLLLGQCLYLSNHAAEAIPYLEKAQKTNEVLYMLGSIYLRNRDYPKAEATFAKLYNADAGSAATHLITAQLMMRQDYVDEAANELQQAIKLDPKLPQARFILAEIRLGKGDPDDAIRLLSQEIALNPNFAMAYYKLGDAYTRKQDWPAAVRLLQQSVWLNPDYSGPFILLGRCYGKLNQLENAEGVLRHAVQIDPKNSSAHYLLGQTLMQLGKTDEGRQMLNLSQKLKPQ